MRPASRLVPLLLLACVLPGMAQEPVDAESAEPPADAGRPLHIRRTTGPIDVDGHLGDAGWQGADPVTTWYETRPGDNVEPPVASVGYLAYDDEYLYAGFRFDDPEPDRIRAPYSDRDHISGRTDDYGGLFLDSSPDGTAVLFLVTPRGIQYDAVTNDATGEDASPDFFWDSAARITARGWEMEMRVPFSSLRYAESDPEQWGILLFRNLPRDFRYQIFSRPVPRGSTCLVCHVQPLVGLAGLPLGSHWVAAPSLAVAHSAQPRAGLGSSLESDDPGAEPGLDLKWLPSPRTALDATLNPDFSQIESDDVQIGANERFALFFEEKRPFFLERADLFSTPIQALHTRTFTAPRWGTRLTGEKGPLVYTLLAGEDRGGGAVIVPGPTGSRLAAQDFESLVAVGRLRRGFGTGFASFLYSGRAIDETDGGGSNHLFGPDLRWQPNSRHEVRAQFLHAVTETPRRPELDASWDGRHLAGHHAFASWWRLTETWDHYLGFQDVDDEFRADNGFVPQVGFRKGQVELGHSWRPEDRPVSFLRLAGELAYVGGEDGGILQRGIVPYLEFEGLRSSFGSLAFALEDVRGAARIHRRRQWRPYLDMSPGMWWARTIFTATLGDEVDFTHDRLGDGVTFTWTNQFRPTDHLRLDWTAGRRWLDVDAGGGGRRRLFTADVARLKAVYTFNARTWVRLVGQWVDTERDPALYTLAVEPRERELTGSAVVAYKLNWQTVFYAGLGEVQRFHPQTRDLQPAGRELFLKISYALRGSGGSGAKRDTDADPDSGEPRSAHRQHRQPWAGGEVFGAEPWPAGGGDGFPGLL